MSFIPEDDQEYLGLKKISYELKVESMPGGKERRGIIFPDFPHGGDLYAEQDGTLMKKATCDLMIIIPDGYDTTKLDSFYTDPFLKRPGGANPDCANDLQTIFGRPWQFWSRHIDETDWTASVRGLETYIQYVRAAFRNP